MRSFLLNAISLCKCVRVCVCVCVCVCVYEWAWASHSWLFLNPLDGSPPGFSVHGILKARRLRWVDISYSRDLPRAGIEPASAVLVGGFFSTVLAGKPCKPISSVQFISFPQSCLTLCNPMDLSTPGLPVYHQLPEPTQTHVHWVSDAIQPSHPLSSPSPPALNLSQHQGLFNWVSSLHQVVKVLEFQLQHQSFQWTPRTDLLSDGLVGSPCSPRDSQESSPTPQFKSISSSVLSFLYSPTLTSIHDYWKNHSLD